MATAQLTFELLGLGVTIHTPEECVSELRCLDQDAQQPMTITATTELTVTRDGGWLIVNQDGAERTREREIRSVFAAIDGLLFSQTLQRFDGSATIEGAVVRIASARVLMIGEHGCGLTSLALSLLECGGEIEGDTLLFLDSQGAIPLPRRLRLPSSSIEPSGLIATLRSVAPVSWENWYVDPTELGYPWSITRGALDAVVLIEANHGGQSRLRPLPHHRMIQAVVERTGAPAGGGREWFDNVVGLVDAADCRQLTFGTIDTATRALAGLGA